jgi:hypothetical protein
MAEARARFPVLDTAEAGYRLAVGSIRDLPVACVTLVLLLYVPGYLLNELRHSIDVEHVWQGLAVSYAEAVLQAAALAPFAVLVHRRIILGVVQDRYWSAAWARRTAFFFGLAVLVDVGRDLASDWPKFADLLGVPPGFKEGLWLLLLVAGILLVLRTILAFPATATDQTENPIEMSLGHTRGRSWAIFGTFALANAPFVVLIIGAAVALYLEPELVPPLAQLELGPLSIAGVFGVLLNVAMLTLNVAIASHLFMHRRAWSRLGYDAVAGVYPEAQPPLT